MSPNRIVAFLTPLVFAPVAGAVATWIANHVPGAEIPASKLEEVFIGGALIALAPAAQWLHGWQKYEARKADQETAIELANVAAAPAAPVAGAAAGEGDFEEEFAGEPEEFVDEPEDFDVSMESDELDDLDALDEELFADELSETGR